MLGSDMAIDLGTATLKIYLDGRGVVVNEPSIVVHDTITDEVVAVGSEAYQMFGKTSDRFSVIRPLSNGVISDFGFAQNLLNHYIKKISLNKMFMPRAVVSVPCGITEVEKRAVVDAISSCGVRKICLLEEPLAAALGAQLDITMPKGRFVVDIGGGTTNIGVISLGDISVSHSLKIAGSAFDESIVRYVRRKYSLVIGKKTAEEIKIGIGCAYPRPELIRHRVKGRNALTGLPQWAELSCDEMLEAMIEPAMRIVRAVQLVLEQTPPELVGDIFAEGIVLTGGSAQIYGLDILLSKKTKVPVIVAEDPAGCVVRGAGAAIKYLDSVENKGYGRLNPLNSVY